MPWQLIYTSAPRGLLSGQSGFCTVARSADLREALVQRLEQISSYHYLRVSEAATANRNPTISAFRLLDLRGAKYYVLTRIQPCGLDFTARTNHLAHHLVFQPDELARLPSPAAILRHWPGWAASWQGEPRLLEEVGLDNFATAAQAFLPAHTWARLTGDGGRAAGLLESECVRGCYLVCPPGSEEQVLQMYCETLHLLNFNGQFPLRPWRHTFTAFLQAEDNPNDFQWRGCQENTPAYKQALTRSAPMIALRSVRVPANSLVKLAREEPKPPPAPAPAPKPHKADPPAKSPLSLRQEPPSRMVSGPPPVIESLRVKRPVRAERPAWLDLNFSINSATLMRVGIFVSVLAVLLLIKHYSSHSPVEQGNQALAPTPAPAPKPTPASAPQPPPKESPPTLAATDVKPMDSLMGDGPTFVLTTTNLNNFSLPIDSISSFQNLLHRYDRNDPGALPNDIRVEVNTDHWDFAAGSLMKVDGRAGLPQFKASLGEAVCTFDYSDWLYRKGNSLAVQANFDGVTHAVSIHIGFSSPTNGDPFRLLIVNANNPPPPLRLAKESLQNYRQDLGASRNGALRLIPDFHLLSGRKWQLQPLTRPESRSAEARYLYKDWPAGDMPPPGRELDLANIRQDLREDLLACFKALRALCGPLGLPPGKSSPMNLPTNLFAALSEPLGLPLGQLLGSTNTHLESFPAFAQGHLTNLTRLKFAEYLKELKETAPDKSWIKKWHSVDPDEPEKAPRKFRDLYDRWSTNSPIDQPNLTVSIKSGGKTEESNYFFAAWRRLEAIETMLGAVAQVQQRLDELDHAYVALCIVDIVDQKQPRPGVEVIRFDGP